MTNVKTFQAIRWICARCGKEHYLPCDAIICYDSHTRSADPCPFCGTTPLSKITPGGWEVCCPKCQANIKSVTAIHAIQAWNKRHKNS
jgi:hypothetical protein